MARTWLESFLADQVFFQSVEVTNIALRGRFELFFIECGASARYLVKTARIPSDSPSLAHEYTQLQELTAKCPSDWLATVPRPVHGPIEANERTLWIQTVVPGKPTRVGFELHSRVSSWLGQLAASTLTEIPFTRPELLRELRYQVPSATLEPVMLTLENRLPGVMAHNDLNQSNILVENGTLGVVDWIMCQSREIPLYDWLCYCTYCFLDTAGDVRPADAWAGSMRFLFESSLVEEGGYQVLQTCGLPNELFSPIRCLYMLTRLRNIARWNNVELSPEKLLEV